MNHQGNGDAIDYKPRFRCYLRCGQGGGGVFGNGLDLVEARMNARREKKRMYPRDHIENEVCIDLETGKEV